MIAYTVTIKALDVKLRFSIVPDPKLDDLSPIDCRGDLAFFEICEKILPAMVRKDWYIMAGFVSDELNNAQLYSEGDAETANNIIRLTVKETSQGLHPCYAT